MSSINFQNGTIIPASWLNDVNQAVYTTIPGLPSTAAQLPYTPPFTGGVTETTAAKLAQTVVSSDVSTMGAGCLSVGTNNFNPSTITGIENVAVGTGNMSAMTTGYSNTAVGTNNLVATTTGHFNTAIGSSVLWTNTTGSENSAIGLYSMFANESGSANTALGEDTVRYNLDGNNNTGAGVQALYNNVSGSLNTAIGSYAARGVANPPDFGPGIGPSPSLIVAVGANSLYTAAGAENVGIGYSAGYNTTGSYNSYFGSQAGYEIISGVNNVFVGYKSGTNASQVSTASYCVVVGDNAYSSGDSVVAIGSNASVTGDNGVAIGYGVSSPANIFTVCNSSHTFFRPSTDNVTAMGGPSNRWTVVYAGTGTINISDEREKQQIKPIDAAALRAWSKVEYCQFKFNDAVKKKGDAGARWHFGVIAQRVKEAFESEGLDAFAYGVLCYDEWDGGNRYGIRYEEALALECAYLRSQLNQG